MGLITEIAQRRWPRRIVSRLGAGYIRLVFRTGRWRTLGAEIPRAFWDEGKPFIIAFWHGRLLMPPMAWRRGMRMNMLISERGDGPLIAAIIAHFDLGTAWGSSTAKGSRATRTMVRALARNEYAGMTPDGPHGPLMRAATGIVSLAQLSGAPVLPLSYSASRVVTRKGWDRLIVPLPFSRGVFVWGEPVSLGRKATETEQEAARQAIEDRLNATTAKADRLCGRPAVKPAPEPVSPDAGARSETDTLGQR